MAAAQALPRLHVEA